MTTTLQWGPAVYHGPITETPIYMQKKKSKKPLDVLYDDALNALTPAQATLEEIASVGRASVATARAWISGKQKPNKASLALLSAYYKLPEDKLFSPGHFDNINAN